jgi:hypothetical protein
VFNKRVDLTNQAMGVKQKKINQLRHFQPVLKAIFHSSNAHLARVKRPGKVMKGSRHLSGLP